MVCLCEQMENNVIISDYTQMDRIMKEERQYILNIVKAIKKAGCNMLLIQKSILRYGCNRNLPCDVNAVMYSTCGYISCDHRNSDCVI